MKIVGIDLSLTSTGIAVAEDGEFRVQRVTSKGTANDTLRQRHSRLSLLTSRVTEATRLADLVVIEQPAYSQSGGSHHDRSGVWWLVLDGVINQVGADVVEVPPTTLKKYASGKGNASKDDMLTAVIRRYPHIEFSGNDEADAVALMAMGLRAVGSPIEDETKYITEAMAKVAWPPLEGIS